ncbi:MAG: long-chain-fatty-acid--CoA ligase [Candidatus Methanosuratincola sp.]
MSIDSMFSSTAKKFHDKVALKWKGKDYTFGELDSLSTRFAKALSALGVGKGDRVCIFMQNSPEFAIAHFGILKCGGVTVPLNVMYRTHELRHMINDSGAAAVVTSGANLQFVQEVMKDLKSVRAVIVASEMVPEGVRSFYRMVEDFDDTPLPSVNGQEDLAVICYTSGTTGLSKGAMLTHRNFLSNIGTLAEIWELNENDKVLMALPMFHIHGLGIVVHGMAYCGYTVVLHERFDAAKVLEEIRRERCTVFMGVPTMYIKLLEEKSTSHDVSSVRLWTVGSAPMPVEAFNKFREKFGVEILERYGMTETAPVITSNPYRGRRKPGSVGPPIPGVEIAILDDDGKALPPGEVGEIAVRGPNVMRGYWNRPVETEEVFSGGWFHTGDLGKLDGDGYLTIVGRKKEMIIASGFKVFPREVEEVIHQHPKVKEVAVVGIPDPVRGENVKAFVVIKEGENASVEEIEEHCRKNLAAFKVPRIFEFVEAIPRTASGKALNRMLAKVKVKDLMEKSVKSIDRRTSAYEAGKYMKEANVGSLIVTDGEMPIGIVTLRDILYKVISIGSLGKDVSLSSIMSTPLVTVDAEEDIAKAAAIMRQWGVWRLPVKDGNGQIVGVLSGTDIFRAFAGRKMDVPTSF